MSRLATCFSTTLPIIGAIRLPPLPDRPGSPGLAALIDFALTELETLSAGGIDGVLIVNENDRPHRVRAQPETIAAMTRICRAVTEKNTGLAIGCQILLNDPIASLAVAKTSGLDFVRCDHFADPMERPEHGVMVIDPDGLVGYRREIGAESILLLADIQVQQATMTEPRTLKESARRACLHLADAVVVTGTDSGIPPTGDELRAAHAGIADSGMDVPLMLGGGLDADNARRLLALADGAIVGTGIAVGGSVDAAAVARLMQEVAELRVD